MQQISFINALRITIIHHLRAQVHYFNFSHCTGLPLPPPRGSVRVNNRQVVHMLWSVIRYVLSLRFMWTEVSRCVCVCQVYIICLLSSQGLNVID